jgi:hypothetical protein
LKSDSLQIEKISSSNKRYLLSLFSKERWEVSDLTKVDSLLFEHKDSKFKGICHFIAATAYHDYDTFLELEYYRNAFLFFEEKNDKVGMFFSQVKIFNSKVNSSSINEKAKELDELYNELKEIAAETSYLPVELYLNGSLLRKKIKLNRDIDESKLIDVSELTLKKPGLYVDLKQQLFTTLGIAYQKIGKLKEAMYYKRKAYSLASILDYDYPSFLINIGTAHYFLKDKDSAIYYIKKAFSILPEEPKTIYQASIKNTASFNLGILYRDEGKMDSAYMYSEISYKNMRNLMNLKLNKSNLYAEKKFQVQKTKNQLITKDLELKKERQLRNLIITILFISLFIIWFLIYVYRKTKSLKKEADDLKDKREQLLRIISHDLGEPLQVFLYSYSVVPNLLDSKKYKELKTIQNSLAETIIGLQKTLNNLSDWNTKFTSKREEEKTMIKVDEYLNQVLETYKIIADIKSISLELACEKELYFKTYPFYFGNLARNIISNSIKHGASNQTIYIRSKKTSENKCEIYCSNVIDSESNEKATKLIRHLNNEKQSDYADTRTGMKLIKDAKDKLNADVKYNIKDNLFEVSIQIPEKK